MKKSIYSPAKRMLKVFSAAVFILSLFAVNSLNTANAQYSSGAVPRIEPASVTIPVGGTVQFRTYEYNPVSGGTIDGTTGHAYFYDPFYVQESGSQTGYFTGVNPGTVTVTAGNPNDPVRATVTVTGSPVAATGTIQITSAKNIAGQMFPVISGCVNGSHCRFGRMDNYSSGGNFKINNSFNPPVLMTDQILWLNATSKGNETGPWAFTLGDPLNPVVAPFASAANEVNTDTDWAGDFGPALVTSDVAFSKDGSYQFNVDSYGRINGWHNGAKRTGFMGSGGGVFRDLTGVVDRGDNTFLITNNMSFNVTNFNEIPKVTNSRGNLVDGPLPNLPSSFPRMTSGKKFILSDENYVASFEGPGFSVGSGTPTAPRLRIYDLGQSSPVATLDISADIPSGRYPVFMFQQKRDATTDYLVMMLTPSAGSAASSVYVYKYNFSTKALTKGVDGAPLKDGSITGATGFNVGNGQRGVIVFTSNGTSEGRARAYLYTDLADKVTKDVLSNSPVTLDGIQFGPATSLVSGNSTYVYSSSRWHDVFAWKLDLRGASGGGSTPTPTPTSTPPSGGGGGGGAPAGSCDFTLTPNPASLSKTVPSGQARTISIGLSTTRPADTTCPAMTLNLTTVRSGGNTVASPLSTSLTVAPGYSTVAIYNVNGFPGSYTIPIKAYGRGVQKTINVQLDISN